MLQRNYPGNQNKQKYSWMQTGFFDELEQREQVYRWGLTTDFNTRTQQMLDDLDI